MPTSNTVRILLIAEFINIVSIPSGPEPPSCFSKKINITIYKHLHFITGFGKSFTKTKTKTLESQDKELDEDAVN